MIREGFIQLWLVSVHRKKMKLRFNRIRTAGSGQRIECHLQKKWAFHILYETPIIIKDAEILERFYIFC